MYAGFEVIFAVGWFVETVNGPNRVPAVPDVAGPVTETSMSAVCGGVWFVSALAPFTRYQ